MLNNIEMLTRRFYEFDEVIASLIKSFYNQAPYETLFWAKELIDSSASSYLIESLVLVYALRFGPNRLEFINVLSGVALRKTLSEHDLMRVTYLLTLITSNVISNDCISFITSETINSIQNIPKASIDWLGGRESRAFDIAMYYLSEVAEPLDEESLAPLELPALPTRLSVIFNLQGRQRRFFPIIPVSLYGMARRGCMLASDTTISTLLVAHQNYHKSIAWRDAQPPENAYTDNDELYGAWENYTNKVFADDIPDEWSLEDQLKSHGPGCITETNRIINVRKWYMQLSGIDDSRLDSLNIEYPNILPNALFIGFGKPKNI